MPGWNTHTNYLSTDAWNNAKANGIGLDFRTWGGDVDGAGYKLSNAKLSVATLSGAGWVDVRSFSGVDATGATDSTTGIQNAYASIATTGGVLYFPSGRYKVSAAIIINGTGTVWLKGSSCKATEIFVSNTISLSANGVFCFSNATGLFEEGGGVKDMTIRFEQPDSTSPSAMIHFPAAIYDAGVTHFRVERVNIVAGWDGVNIYSGSGATITHSTFSCFHRTVSADRLFDGLIVTGCECWPVGLTANQGTAFVASASTAFYLGHVDGLAVQGCLLMCGAKSFDIHLGADGSSTTGFVSDCWLDSSGNISVENAQVVFSGIHGSVGTTSTIGVDVSGGSQVIFQNFKLLAFGTGALALFRWVPSLDVGSGSGGGEPFFKLLNGQCIMGSIDTYGVLAQAYTTSVKPALAISEVSFTRDPTVAYTKPVIDILAPSSGGLRCRVRGCDFSDLTSGSGLAVAFGDDDYHIVSDCIGVGWGKSLVGTTNSYWSASNRGFI